MITTFDGEQTTPRRRAKELTVRLLEAFAREWIDTEGCDAQDVWPGGWIPLAEGLTERERQAVHAQLVKITRQLALYHGVSLHAPEA
mgnify:CR=1 FL=1